jgi:hypothetical protein
MALSLERIIWYNFNGFLHVEMFVEELFFPRQIAGNECWEVVPTLLSNKHGDHGAAPPLSKIMLKHDEDMGGISEKNIGG